MEFSNVSQSKTRADPLLPTTSQSISRQSKACTRLIFFLIPILACSFVLTALVLLVYRLEVQITDISISLCLATYEPKLEVVVVIFVGATLMFFTSIMRNIQISVYHRRKKSEFTAMKVLNSIAATALILSYIGFILLALFDVNDPDPAVQLVHAIGSYIYFGFSGLFGLLHSYLLCKQTQYPMICKIVYAMVAVATIASSILYVSNFEEYNEFEWYTVALNALYVGLVSILFLVDPVDDELRDFFCCHRRSQLK